MGCGGSKKNDRSGGGVADKKVSISVGEAVKLPATGPILIFVFGGPGSKKGRLLSELVETYGFTFINVEKLLLRHLVKQVPEPDPLDTTFDAQDVIKEDPQLVSLRWLLEEVGRQMETTSTRFIVDVMPNLKFLINNDIFLADCTEEMNRFEERHPIAFGINFIQRSAKRNKKEAHETSEKEEKVAVKSDEADSSRTRRRITLFENNVRPFIDYFQHSDRLVSLDVTGARAEQVWSRLCELFTGLHLNSQALVNYILVFIFEEEELQQVNTDLPSVQVISLKSLVNGPNTSLEEAAAALTKHLDKSDPTIKTFIVDLQGTSINKDLVCQVQAEGPCIVFVDEDLAQLHRFISLHKTKGGAAPLKFRAVSSTENIVCLFPSHVPVTLCKEIAITLGRTRQAHHT
ncbi:hypothetical protein BaRGS_00031841 [Batillaria attramentaria]|uniref:Adenylate kinase n=1 Tax=Batillaria attramentaria TaxID=370345 RepID=A0ABD0JPW6_9CAEN